MQPDQIGFWESRDGFVGRIADRYTRKASPCTLEQGREAAALAWDTAAAHLEKYPAHDAQSVIDTAMYACEGYAQSLADHPTAAAEGRNNLVEYLTGHLLDKHLTPKELRDRDEPLVRADYLEDRAIADDLSLPEAEREYARVMVEAVRENWPEVVARVEIDDFAQHKAAAFEDARAEGEARRFRAPSPFDRAAAKLDTPEAKAARADLQAQRGQSHGIDNEL